MSAAQRAGEAVTLAFARSRSPDVSASSASGTQSRRIAKIEIARRDEPGAKQCEPDARGSTTARRTQRAGGAFGSLGSARRAGRRTERSRRRAGRTAGRSRRRAGRTAERSRRRAGRSAERRRRRSRRCSLPRLARLRAGRTWSRRFCGRATCCRNEPPLGVRGRAREGLVLRQEIRGLQRPRGRLTVDANDAAARTAHQAPVGAAGHWVGVDAAQVPANVRVPIVDEQVLELLRILRRARRARAIRDDRTGDLVAGKKQLGLPLALRLGARDLADRRERDAHDRNCDQEPQVGKAAGRRGGALRGRHQRFSNGFPSAVLPLASYYTAYTVPCAIVLGTGTMTHVSVLSVIGSSGTARM